MFMNGLLLSPKFAQVIYNSSNVRKRAFGHARPAKITIRLRSMVRFKSACALEQSDQNLHWRHFGYPRIQSFFGLFFFIDSCHEASDIT